MSVFFTSKEPTPAPPIKATVSGGEDGPSSSTVSAVSGRRNGPKVLSVRFGIGNAKHDGEGRSITVEYDKVKRGGMIVFGGSMVVRQGN